MKKIIMGLVMALSTLTASAQFEVGKNYIGASVSGLGLSYSKQAKVNFDLSATAGRLLAENWMLLANVEYQHLDSVNIFELGVGGRYYIVQNGLYLGLGVAYAHSKYESVKSDNCFITPEIGYAFFLNQHVTIEPAIYYRMSVNDFADASTVGLKIGFGYYF